MSIFVSYSRRDYITVYAIVRELRNHGVDIWIDQEDIDAGVRWDDKLQYAIEECSHILLMMSVNSMKSQNVRDEFSFAIGEDKTILIVLIDDVKLPLRLHRFQYIDFRSNYDQAFERLLKHLPATGLALDSEDTTLQQSPLQVTGMLTRESVSSIIFPEDEMKTNPPQKTALMLRFEAEGVDSRAWKMEHNFLTMGRGSECDIKLTNPRISRKHLEIIRKDNEYLVHDFRSSNGTEVNGEDITGATYKLRDGDVISIAGIVHVRAIFTTRQEDDTQRFVFNEF